MTEPAARGGSRRGALLRLALSLSVLALLAWHLGPRTIAQQIAGLDLRLVALAFALLIGEVLVRCVNWWQLGRASGCTMSLGDVMHAYMVGGFFGTFLPSTLGTDAARCAFAAARNGGRPEVLLATTVSLNLVNLAAVCALALLACTWAGVTGEGRRATVAASALVGSGCLAAIAAVAVLARWGRARRLVEAEATEGGWLASARRIAARFAGAILLVRGGPAGVARVGATAALSQILRTIGWLALLASTGASAAFVGLLVLGPLATIGSLLPISVGGFGGQQAVSVYLLADWGVQPGHAFAASLVQSTLYLIMYSLGSLAWLASAGRRSAEPLKAKLPAES